MTQLDLIADAADLHCAAAIFRRDTAPRQSHLSSCRRAPASSTNRDVSACGNRYWRRDGERVVAIGGFPDVDQFDRGGIVYVSCHPVTRVAHTRIIQARSRTCSRRRHEVGARLFLWEILPDRNHGARPVWTDEYESDRHVEHASAARSALI